MVRVFVLQQASSHEPPLLIVENTHALNPSELRVLCELAGLNVRGRSALKLVLVLREDDPDVRPRRVQVARSLRLGDENPASPQVVFQIQNDLH